MLRLVLITCLVATALGYGRSNVHKTGSVGCSSPAGCPSAGGAPAVHRQSSGGGGYWWANNNPFRNTPQRGPSSVSGSAGGSKRPVGSKLPSSGGQSYPSAGASGFPSAGGLGSSTGGFGSQPVRVNPFVGPMGICPRDFICVHWQLCNRGQVILDGSGKIDKSKRRPSQGYKDLRRCGDDMFCCGVAPGYTAQGVFDTLTSTLPIGSSQTTESVFGTNSFLSSSHISSQRIDSQNVPDHASSISISHSSSGATSTNPNVAPSLSLAPGESLLVNVGHDSVAGHGNVNKPFSETHSNNFASTLSQSFSTSDSVKGNEHPSLSNSNFVHANLNTQSHSSQVSNPGTPREESAFTNLGASSGLSGTANNVVSSVGISEPSPIPNELLSYLPPNESPEANNNFATEAVGTPIAQEDIRIVGLQKQPDVSHSLSEYNQDKQDSNDDQNLGVPSGNQNIHTSSGVLSQSIHGSSIPSQTNQAPSQESFSGDSYSGTSTLIHSSQVSGQVQPSQNPVGSFDNPSSSNALPQSHSSTSFISGPSEGSSVANLAPVRDQVPIDFPSEVNNQQSQLFEGTHSTSVQIDSSPLIEKISGVKTPSPSQSFSSQQLGSHSQSFDHHETSPSSGLSSNVAVDRINEPVPELESGYLPPLVSSEGPSSVVSEQSIKQNTLQGGSSGSGSYGSGSVISSSQGGSQSFGQSSFQGSSLKPVKPVSGGASSGSFGQGQISSGGSYNPGSSGSVSHQSSSSGSFGQAGVGVGGSQKPLATFPQSGGSGCAGGSAPGCGGYSPSAGGSASIQQGSRFPSGGSGSAGAGGFGSSGSIVSQQAGSLSGSSVTGGSSGSFPSGSGGSSGSYGGSSGSIPSGSGSSSGSFPGGSGSFPVGGSSLPIGSGANYPSSSGSASGSSGSFPSGGGSFPSGGGSFPSGGGSFPSGAGGSSGSFPGSSGTGSGSFPGGSGSLHTSSGSNYPSGSGSSSVSVSGSSGSFPSGGGSFPSGSGGSSGSFPGSSGTGSGSFPGGSGSVSPGSGGNYPSGSGGSSGGSSSSGSGGYGSSGSGSIGGSSGVGSTGSFSGSSGSFPSGSGSFPSGSGSFPSGSGSSSGSFPSGSGSGGGAGGYGPSSGIASNQPANPGPGGPFNQLGLPSQPSSSGAQQTQPMNQMMMGMMGMGGNPLVPGSCSAGTFCVPRFQCNPYNGFIIMDPNQLQAVWPDAPQVPLLDCIIPAGVLNDGVCCQQQHPIVGPNGQILD